MRLLILTLLLVPHFMKAQSIAQKADELLTAYSTQHKFSGAVLIAKEGNILFEKAYGYADLGTQRLNTTETEFRVGSLTKMFTSTAILQLVQQGKLSLTDRVSKYLPQFANGDQVQIQHLLSHTSGIKGTTEAPEPTTLEESVARFRCDSLAFTPGSRFEYNNFNYILLAYIVQKVSGMPFEQLLKTRVLDKAGMTHSGLDTKDRKSDVKALGYVTNPETIAWEEPKGGNVAIASGAGALYSTVGDLYKWSQAISNHVVLPDSVLKKAMKPFQNNYGFGWMTREIAGTTQVGHTGSIPGFIANFMKFPKEDITIILLCNYQDVDGNQLSNDLVAVTFGNPYTLPVQKKAVALTNDVLQQYVGQYQQPSGFSITVSTEGGKLFALAQGDMDKMELTPESETKFFLKGPETEIEFKKENGVITQMFVNMQGGQTFAKVK